MLTTTLVRPAAHMTSHADADEVVLELRGLTKRFGSTVAVDNLDLTIRRGEVLGFLGPNGSGKSTTVSMVLGLVKPSAGSVHVMGQALSGNPSLAPRYIGAIIENPAFYPYLSGRDNLRAQALLAGGVPDSRIDDLLRLVNMRERAIAKFKTYSLGMKQRIGIASTLLTAPALVILDEPTNGLDPAGQREIRAIIPRLAQQGHSVLLASHLLHEVEQVSDRIVIIRQGRKVTEGSVADLLHRGGYFSVQLEAGLLERAAAVARAVGGVASVTVSEDGLLVEAPEDLGATLNRALAGAGLYASQIVRTRSTLEDLFLELTADTPPALDA